MLTITVEPGSAAFHLLSTVYAVAVEAFGEFMQHGRPLAPKREDTVPIFAAWTMCFIKAATMVEHAVLHRRQCFPQRRESVSD